MEGYSCDVSQLPYGICPGVSSGPGLTLRRAPRSLTSDCETACCGQKGLFSSKTRGIPHVRDHTGEVHFGDPGIHCVFGAWF